MLGLSRKTQAALTAALLFYVISSPFTYRLVDSVVGGVVGSVVPQFTTLFKIAEAGCPTNYGLLVHAAVYGLVTYHLMSS
jgi:hypothetical protein